jgi:AcrR family transcriptional regulator
MAREEILAAAQRQLNLDPRASMAEIATAAGIGRATLHRHFSSRETLLEEIGTRSLDRWEQRLDTAGVEAVAASGEADAIARTLRELVSGFVADSDEFGFALTDQFLAGEPELVDRTDSLFEREVSFYAAAQRAGVLRDDVTARWLGHAVYGLLVAARDALRAGDVPHRDLDALVISTFLEGGRAR